MKWLKSQLVLEIGFYEPMRSHSRITDQKLAS